MNLILGPGMIFIIVIIKGVNVPRVYVEVRGQLGGVCSILPLCGFEELKSCRQALVINVSTP